jgi:hypothetical protein
MANYLIFAAAIVTVIGIFWFLSQRKRDAAWKQFASEIGGDFFPGGFLRASKIEAHAGQAVVTIDTYSVSSGDSSTNYTRMRTPIDNPDGFKFTIQRKGLIGRLDKALGTQHIDIGDADFDKDFLVQSNNEFRIQSLLLDQGLRTEMQAQKSLDLGIRGNELRLEVTNVVDDTSRLQALYKLFGDVLAKLG